jgi:uncharacterized protein (TIGR03067 family)
VAEWKKIVGFQEQHLKRVQQLDQMRAVNPAEVGVAEQALDKARQRLVAAEKRLSTERPKKPDKSPLATGDGNKEPLDVDYAKLEGTWQVVSLEVDGKEIPKETIKESRLIIKGKEFTMKEKIATYKGTFSIDSSKSPKTIDIKFTEGPEKGNTSLGIYELDGDDLKLCLTVTAKERPTEFTTKAKSGHGFELLKRENP